MELLPALARYFEAYAGGDLDGLMEAFAPEPEVNFGTPEPIRGAAAVRAAHERIGTFRFDARQVFGDGDPVQVVEGVMHALRDGTEVREAPVPFAALAQPGAAGALRSLRFYYDGRRVAAAVEAAGLDGGGGR